MSHKTLNLEYSDEEIRERITQRLLTVNTYGIGLDSLVSVQRKAELAQIEYLRVIIQQNELLLRQLKRLQRNIMVKEEKT